MINWHALTGCDTTGHIHGKGEKGCFAIFVMASHTIMIALAGLGEEDDRPKKCYVAVKSLFALFSVQVESTLGKRRCSGVFVQATRR